jgi:hypothetical protein
VDARLVLVGKVKVVVTQVAWGPHRVGVVSGQVDERDLRGGFRFDDGVGACGCVCGTSAASLLR